MMELVFVPDKRFMLEALKEASEAFDLGEVPVGAVIVRDGTIIGRGHNTREKEQNPMGHAELNAIREASRELGTWRLNDCILYVTLEPCPMCTGAILNSRIKTVVYGTRDERAGCLGTKMDLTKLEVYHTPEICPDYMKHECKEQLEEFFVKKRK